jgi:glycerate 2-kinase
MKVLIAMDSFKGTFGSLEIAGIVEKGIKKVYGNAEVNKIAMADGGEGTVRSLVEGLNGEYVRVEVCDPLENRIMAEYGIVNGDTAIMEMAEASGLCLVPEDQRNPLVTSTYGTGELIADAVGKGCRKIILGIGGSATNDGGMGMATALGIRFLDRNENAIGQGGGSLDRLVHIDMSCLNPGIREIEFLVACDVDNPLCGDNGASRVYGLQKGATQKMVEILDQNLSHYAEVIKESLSVDVLDMKGAGAAGGLGAGLVAFCDAKLAKGVDIVLDILNFNEKVKDSDIVITGEGRIDEQTVYGKVPVGVAARAKKYGKPVFAIAGFTAKGAELVYLHGIDAVISSMVGPMSLDEAIMQSPKLIEEAAERLFRIIHAMEK